MLSAKRLKRTLPVNGMKAGRRCRNATTMAVSLSATLNGRRSARLLADIEAGGVDAAVTYKVDGLSRSLLDFARLMGIFDKHGVRFVAVTQQLDTKSSVGRLSLNMLLSFAQFEREIIAKRMLTVVRIPGRFASR
jgi:hypothetical protein